MDDQEIRRLVLRRLFDVYQKDAHDFTMRGTLESAVGVSGNELVRNVKYLGEKSLIEVRWYLGGEFMCRIKSRGIDVLQHEPPPGTKSVAPAAQQSEALGLLSIVITVGVGVGVPVGFIYGSWWGLAAGLGFGTLALVLAALTRRWWVPAFARLLGHRV